MRLIIKQVVLLVVISAIGCSHSDQPTSKAPAPPFDYSKARPSFDYVGYTRKQWKEVEASLVRVEAVVYGNGRIGPIVITDAEDISKIRKCLRDIKQLEVNDLPHRVYLSGDDIYVTFVYREGSQLRCRFSGPELFLGDDERVTAIGATGDLNTLIWSIAETYKLTHPDDWLGHKGQF